MSKLFSKVETNTTHVLNKIPCFTTKKSAIANMFLINHIFEVLKFVFSNVARSSEIAVWEDFLDQFVKDDTPEKFSK